MSFNFVVEQLNTSMRRIVSWYREFMDRTEQCFIAMHNRVSRLEERQAWVAPSDEQVERVLRKILAERFAHPPMERPEGHNAMQYEPNFVGKPETAAPHPILIDYETIKVDPNAVPDQSYGEQLKEMEEALHEYPNVDLSKTAETCENQDSQTHDIESSPNEFKRPRLPPINPQHDRPWS